MFLGGAATAAFSACGTTAVVVHGSKSAASTTQGPGANVATQTPGGLVGAPSVVTPGPVNVDLSRPVTAQSLCGDYPPGGPTTLGQYLSAVSATGWGRTAAVVTITSGPGAAIYNTPDGSRWSEAWRAAGHALEIYTPYGFTVVRPLSPGLTAGQKVTGYVEGGAMPNGDNEGSCTGQPSVPHVLPGRQAVVIFGGNMKDLNTGPTVSLFDVIQGKDGVQGSYVVTERGREPIPLSPSP